MQSALQLADESEKKSECYCKLAICYMNVVYYF